jgi:phage-related protein
MRILEPYKNYFWEFYDSLGTREKEKVDYVFQIIISVSRIPVKFLKHVDDGIYEIRVEVSGNIYRIFSFFDNDKLVILLHGFQKKSQKLPGKEVDKAKKLRREYYENKLSKNN